MKSKIVTPCHWNLTVLEEIVDMNQSGENIAVDELYGVVPGPIGHGRAKDAVPSIGKEKALEFKKRVDSYKLGFAYLINAPFNGEISREIEDYLAWVINDFRPNALIVASHSLMRYIRKLFPDIDIYVSAIASVSDAEALEKYLDVFPAKVVVQHDVNRNFGTLKDLIKVAEREGVNIEIMLTEGCLRHCSKMKAHYTAVGSGKTDRAFHKWCNAIRIAKPEQILNANFIRPEDMRSYEEIGIKHFKVTGRSKPANWLPEVVKAYLQRSYSGNLIRLLGMDPRLGTETWMYIDNKALDGFLEGYPTGDIASELEYCRIWTSKLLNEGRMYISKSKI